MWSRKAAAVQDQCDSASTLTGPAEWQLRFVMPDLGETMFGLMTNVPLAFVIQEVCWQGTKQWVPSLPVLGPGGDAAS